MKSIFNLFQLGVLFIFLFDIIYNFFPSEVYQYFLGVLFMIGGILFFNQKWIAYMNFDQKWKSIIFSLVLLFGILVGILGVLLGVLGVLHGVLGQFKFFFI